MAMWKYADRAYYEAIDAAIRDSELHVEAQTFRKTLPPLFLSSNEEFFISTGDYEQ